MDWLIVVLAIIGVILSFFLGYSFGKKSNQLSKEDSERIKQIVDFFNYDGSVKKHGN